MNELHIKGFKGTQGKWIIDPQNLGTRWNIESETGVNVAIASQVARRGELTERDANANLIAAAPELLFALQDALHAYDKHGEHPEWDFAREAINKALGE